jgi:hypothetical protein
MNLLKPQDNQPNEQSAVDKFIEKTGRTGVGRLLFVLDATASRGPTWDMARALTGDMIREAASVGQLEMQLVFFSGGMDTPRRCAVSEWTTDPVGFVQAMERVRCQSGYTQIAKALEHAVNETMRDRVSATVLIGDMCEAEGGDNIDRMAQTAHRLGQLRTPVFAFLEGNDRTAEAAFRKIAELSHGAFGRFDAGGVKQLGEMLKAAALYAVGGVDALAGRDDSGSALLLGQLRKGTPSEPPKTTPGG